MKSFARDKTTPWRLTSASLASQDPDHCNRMVASPTKVALEDKSPENKQPLGNQNLSVHKRHGKAQAGSLAQCWTQIILGSLCVTFSRGILNALNACGAYGTGDIELAAVVNIGNALSYGLLGWVSGHLVNRLGFRISSLIGAIQTTVLLCLVVGRGVLHVIPMSVIWIVGLIDGVASGLIWNSISTITIIYPPMRQRGLATTALYTTFSCGAAAGGLAAFFLNSRSGAGGTLSLTAFAWMIAMTVFGIFLALCLAPTMESVGKPWCWGKSKEVKEEIHFREVDSPSDIVARETSNASTISVAADSEHLSDLPTASEIVVEESKHGQNSEFLTTLQDRNMQCLMLFAFASLFHQTYLFNGLNYRGFSVRTRGLNGCAYWVGRIPFGIFHGRLVDAMAHTSKTRAMHANTLLAFLVIAAQSLCVLFYITRPLESAQLDIAGSETATMALGILVFFLYGGLDTVSQAFAMWLFSAMGSSPSKIPHYVAIYRSVQGFGVATAWFIDLARLLDYPSQFLMSLGFWIIAFPGLLSVIKSLKDEDVSPVFGQSSFCFSVSLLFQLFQWCLVAVVFI